MSKPTDDNRYQGIQSPQRWADIDPVINDLGAPFVHPISVGWGDCDPAQIAYTANIPGWGLESIEAWYRACLGIGWFELNLQNGVGTPFVSLNFEFKSPITPLGKLLVSVYVKRLGKSSISHCLEGHQNGTLSFVGNTVAAFVEASTMKSMPIPPNMRHSIQQYALIQNREFTS
ncbi:MAG: acyl-CoA thioesterase [bacterium]